MESEQITNTEDLKIATPKVKNPKKVAAGNALAKKNAEAKKFKENYEKEEKEEKDEKVTVSTFYNGILSIAGLVGAGFTLYHGWKSYQTYDGDSLRSVRDKFIPSKPKEVVEPEKPKEVVEPEKPKEVKKSKSVSPSLRG